jgi:hypothetical protein
MKLEANLFRLFSCAALNQPLAQNPDPPQRNGKVRPE